MVLVTGGTGLVGAHVLLHLIENGENVRAIYRSQNNIEKTKIDLLLNWLFYYRYKEKYSLSAELKYWFYLLKSNPKLLTSTLAIKYCPIIRKRKQLFPILFR